MNTAQHEASSEISDGDAAGTLWTEIAGLLKLDYVGGVVEATSPLGPLRVASITFTPGCCQPPCVAGAAPARRRGVAAWSRPVTAPYFS